jgi:hypothetical protein
MLSDFSGNAGRFDSNAPGVLIFSSAPQGVTFYGRATVWLRISEGRIGAALSTYDKTCDKINNSFVSNKLLSASFRKSFI